MTVLIFRYSLLDLSLVQLTNIFMSDSNLPQCSDLSFITGGQDKAHQLPEVFGVRSSDYPEMKSVEIFPGSLCFLSAPGFFFFDFSAITPSSLTQLSEVRLQHLSARDTPHTGHVSYLRGYSNPKEVSGMSLPELNLTAAK